MKTVKLNHSYKHNVIYVLISLLVITCEDSDTNYPIIHNTKNYIAFARNPEAGSIYDYNIWLINIETREEIQLTKSLSNWEYYPVWLSDSELLYLIEPQEKTFTETDIVYVNFQTGETKILDFWSWKDDPGMDKVSADIHRRIYYSSLQAHENRYTIYRLVLDSTNVYPEELMPASVFDASGIVKCRRTSVSLRGERILLVACDTTKYKRFHSHEKQMYYYDIYIGNFNSRGHLEKLQKLTHNDYDNMDPIWIDDNKIVFSSNRNGNYDIYVMDITSRQVNGICQTDNSDEIWILNIKTGETWFLTKGFMPDWSPAQ